MNIFSHNFGDFVVSIDNTWSGFLLRWDDCVANEWIEEFADLSVCLARLAVLIACSESDFEKGFAQVQDVFVSDVCPSFFGMALG